MRWEELSADQFAAAVETCGSVCLVSLSVIERHGSHLPLGTDLYEGRGVLARVAEREPVIEFPDYIFTQIPEARHLPGTISINLDLMVQLLDNVCREIARNGLKKIVLVNAHGGNHGLLSLFNMRQLDHPRDYVVYVVNPVGAEIEGLALPWPAEGTGHAGATETSMMLALRPDLVDMARVPDVEEGQARGRLQALRAAGVMTGVWWYADHPTHYQGDATQASAAAGEQILGAWADYVARAVRAIKADSVTQDLQEAFYAQSAAPLSGGSTG